VLDETLRQVAEQRAAMRGGPVQSAMIDKVSHRSPFYRAAIAAPQGTLRR
jgi:hypothetical protein